MDKATFLMHVRLARQFYYSVLWNKLYRRSLIEGMNLASAPTSPGARTMCSHIL